jgi:hypothetical protein
MQTKDPKPAKKSTVRGYMGQIDDLIEKAKAAKKKRDEGAAELAKLKKSLMALKEGGHLNASQAQAVGLAFSTHKRKPKTPGQAASKA